MKKSNASWREIGGQRKYFRSSWEANYARYLQFLKDNKKILDWEHEPKTFWFEGIRRGVCSYKPDFRVVETQTKDYWVEVKGHYDNRSKTKIKRFKSYFPKEVLILVDKDWFIKYGSIYNYLDGWETPEGLNICKARIRVLRN